MTCNERRGALIVSVDEIDGMLDHAHTSQLRPFHAGATQACPAGGKRDTHTADYTSAI